MRREHRIECYFPAAIEFGENRAKGFLTNVSAGGGRFSGMASDLRALALEEGAELTLKFEFIGMGGARPVRCIVRNLERNRDLAHLGMQFKNAAPVTEKIGKYVQEVCEFSNRELHGAG